MFYTITCDNKQLNIENAKIIALVTKNTNNILFNKKINLALANLVSDLIIKHTSESTENAKDEEEATNINIIAMLEIYIALVKSTYNIEKIIMDKYNISKFIIDPLKIEALIATDNAYNTVAEQEKTEEKKKKQKEDNDRVGSKMYG